MLRPVSPLIAASFLAFAACGAPAEAGSAPIKKSIELHPCPEVEGAQCGYTEVPEDRGNPGSRTLKLSVLVLPASRADGSDPVFFFAGGPGEAATRAAPTVISTDLRRLNPARDVVFIDQRGTGDSNPLLCPPQQDPQAYFGNILGNNEALRACRAALEKKADLTKYVTSIAADDVDEVRARLGYDKVIVWGGSYGTRAAMEYMRRHGDHVSGAILDGVFPFESRDPLSYALDAQKALERVFADCASDSVCASDYPHLRQRFDELLDQFRSGPKSASIRTAPDAPPTTVQYSIGDFGYTIRAMLYSSEATARLPLEIVRAAKTGNVDSFAQAYYDRASLFARLIPTGLYLSVMCAEEVPPLSADEIVRWTAGTFLGVYLINEYQRACAQWSRASIPPRFHGPLRSSIPTLVFSGGRDPATPAGGAGGVLRHLTRSRHVVFPKVGHGVSYTACAISLISSFLADPSFEQLDRGCVNDVSNSTPFQRKGDTQLSGPARR
ncbi:MAG TPA: alpha/beta hydrolase [Steroidobacteraceae bacterium]